MNSESFQQVAVEVQEGLTKIGRISVQTLNFNNYSKSFQIVSICNDESDIDTENQGLLSLSFSNSSFLSEFNSQQFSIVKTSQNISVLTLGETSINYLDESTKNFEIFILESEDWDFSVSGFIFSELMSLQNSLGKIDFYSENIEMPTKDLEKFYSAILQNHVCEVGEEGLLICECSISSDFSELTFRVGDSLFSLPFSKVIQQLDAESQCKLLVSPNQNDIWVLGKPFLSYFDLLFDTQNLLIAGWASEYSIENDAEVTETALEEPGFSSGMLILALEIAVISFIIFVIARITYGCIENVKFAVEPELELPLVPVLDPDCSLAKKIAKLKEES